MDEFDDIAKVLKHGKAIGLLVLLVVFGIAVFASIATVPPGRVGVVTTFGKISDITLAEGLNFKLPWQRVYHVSIKDEPVANSMEAYTRDMQQATITFQFTARLSPDFVVYSFRNTRNMWMDMWVRPIVFRSIEEIMGTIDSTRIVQNREIASISIRDKINEGLQDKGIMLTNFSMTNIDFTDAYNQANEDKQIAEQMAVKATYETTRIREVAKQTVARAEAEAKALQIKGTAISQNPGIIQLEAIDKWDGKLPMVSGGNTPFINLPSMK